MLFNKILTEVDFVTRSNKMLKNRSTVVDVDRGDIIVLGKETIDFD